MCTPTSFYWDRAPGTKPWSQLGSLGAAVTVMGDHLEVKVLYGPW
jgi:hypothetical protein